MNLIFLYGLPGSGKLTVAKELVSQLGEEYKIFHNHATIDIISPIIPHFHPKSLELNLKFRLLMIDACAELDIHLITTYVYAFGDESDDGFVNKILEIVEKRGGKVLFVNLQCDLEIVFQRLKNPDRRKHRKLTDPDKLRDSMNRWELDKTIPYVDNLVIDSGELRPYDAAQEIITYYDL